MPYSTPFTQNWDPDVREDMEMFLSRLVPEVITLNRVEFIIVSPSLSSLFAHAKTP